MTTPVDQQERFAVVQCSYDELSDHMPPAELEHNRNFWGKLTDKAATYVVIYHNRTMISAEPFYHKDVMGMLGQVYLMGYWDGHLDRDLGEPGAAGVPVPIVGEAPEAIERVRMTERVEVEDDRSLEGWARIILGDKHTEPKQTTERVKA